MKSQLTAALLASALLAGPLAAQQSSPDAGKLLVASPDMKDGNFAKTVVLLLHSDSNGTVGVIVNRPTWVVPKQVDPDLDKLEGYDGKVYRGGPLAASQLVYLMRDPPSGAFKSKPIFDGVYAGGDTQQLESLAKGVGIDRLRLYAGHAEWAGGQLEREIAAGQWVVVDGTAERVFTPQPALLWEQIVHKGSEVVVDARPASPPGPAPLGVPRLRRLSLSTAVAAASTYPR